MVTEAPVQGWAQWIADIGDMVRVCETEEALTRLQQTYRRELRQLATVDPEGFAATGTRFQERRNAVTRKVARPAQVAVRPVNGARRSLRARSKPSTVAHNGDVVLDAPA